MASKVKTVTLWIRAFIPDKVFRSDGTESTVTVPSGPHKGKKLLPGPLNVGWFHTDDRGFSDAKGSTSRAHCEVLVDFAAAKVEVVARRCDETAMFLAIDDASPKTGVGDASRLVVKDVAFSSAPGGGQRSKFVLFGEANNPLLPGSPDIDWDIRLTVDRDASEVAVRLTAEGLVDPFPAYEMYAATDASPSPKKVFNIAPEPGKDPWNLFGPPDVPAGGQASWT